MVKANGYTINSFPDGTPLIKKDLHTQLSMDVVDIVWTFESMAELPTVIMIAKDAKDRGAPIQMFMPYIPNARMDRAHDEDVFTMKWFANEINKCGFNRVCVFDPHSDVAPALIDHCEVWTPINEICEVIEETQPDVIYFPDAGAMKRYEGLVHSAISHVGGKKPYIIHGDKKREWTTGKILGLDVTGYPPKDGKILMIDDICSYGGTMFYSAKKLKELGAGDIDMYVSHCENSILDKERGHLFDDPELIHKVYTTDSIFTGRHDKIKVIEHRWDED